MLQGKLSVHLPFQPIKLAARPTIPCRTTAGRIEWLAGCLTHSRTSSALGPG